MSSREALWSALRKEEDSQASFISSDDPSASRREAESLLKAIESDGVSVVDVYPLGLPWLFLHVFHEDSAVREEVLQVFSPLVLSSEQEIALWGCLKEKLSSPSEPHVAFLSSCLCREMKEEEGSSSSREEDSQAIRIVGAIISALGKALRSPGGIPVINALLTLIERGLKGSESHRVAAFAVWKILIRNFALAPSVLSNPRRSKLILRPLISAANAKTEKVLKAKVEVWWEFLQLMGGDLLLHADSVVLPFLEFLFGKKKNEAALVASPIRKYTSMDTVSLDAFYRLLFPTSKAEEALLPPLTALPPQTGILQRKLLLAHYAVFFVALEKCAELIKFGNHRSLQKFKLIFDALTDTLHGSFEDTEHAEEEEEALKKMGVAYAATVQTIVFENKRKPHILSLLFHILDKTVSILPPRFLQSSSILDTLLHILFQGDFLAQVKEFKNPHAAVFSQILEKGRGFLLLQKITTRAFKDNGSSSKLNGSPDTWQILWKMTLAKMKKHVEQTGEINESSDGLSHDLSTVQSLLSFPIQHFIRTTNKDFWSTWGEFYALVATSASTIVSYKSLELEAFLCRVTLSCLKQELDFFSSQKVITFNNYCQVTSLIASSIIINDEENIHFQNLEPLLDLLSELVSIASEKLSKVGGIMVGIASTLSSLQTIFSHLNKAPILIPVLKSSSNTLLTLLGSNFSSTYGVGFESKAESLSNKIVSVLLGNKSERDLKELFHSSKPFILSALSHSKKGIKAAGLRLWQLRFAEDIQESDIPHDMLSALRKNSALSSESSQSISSMDSLSAPSNPLFSSFSSPRKSSVPTTPKAQSPFASLKKNKRPPTGLSINEENTQDFVPILTDPKERVLTEHQKEVLKTRKDDIPALYSELSRDDSSQIAFSSSFKEDSSCSLMGSNKNEIPSQSLLSSSSAIPPVIQDDENAMEEAPPSLRSNLQKSSSSVTKELEKNTCSSSPKKNKLLSLSKDAPGSKKTDEDNGTPSKRRNKEPPNASPSKKTSQGSIKQSQVGTPSKNRTAKEPSSSPSKKPTHGSKEKNENNSSASVKDDDSKVLNDQIQESDSLQPSDDTKSSSSSMEVSSSQESIHPEGEEEEEVIQSSQSSKTTRKRKRIFRPTKSSSSLSKRSRLEVKPPGKENKGGSNNSATPRPQKNNKFGESPLQIAIKKGCLSRVAELVEGGADVNHACYAGWRPLHDAVKDGESTLEILKLLLSHGSDINAPGGEDGNTPLHEGALYCSVKVLQLLLDNGADPNAVNKDGERPLDLTSEEDIVDLLQPLTSKSSHEKSLPEKKEENTINRRTSRRSKLAAKEEEAPKSKGDEEAKSIAEETSSKKTATKEDSEQVSSVLNEAKEEDSKEDSSISNESVTKEDSEEASSISKDSVTKENSKEVQSIRKESVTKEDSKEVQSIRKESVTKEDSKEASFITKEASKEASSISKESANKDDLKDQGSPSKKNYIEDKEDSETHLLSANKENQPTEISSKENTLSSLSDEASKENISDEVISIPESQEADPTEIPESMEVEETSSNSSPSSDKLISLPKPIIENGETNNDEEIEDVPQQQQQKSLHSSILFSQPPQAKTTSPLATSLAKSRAAKLVELSKAATLIKKADSVPPISKNASSPVSTLLTPPAAKPWQKFFPSPNASPTASILKRRYSDFSPLNRSRKVQFSDPPVSDKVEIPRKSKKNCLESPSLKVPGMLYPSLIATREPVSLLFQDLSNKTWIKTAEKDFKEKGIATIGDLSRMSELEAMQLKGLKPPPLNTLKEALRNYEESLPPLDCNGDGAKEVPKALAPFVEVQTPGGGEKNMQEIYERPSPSPTEEAGKDLPSEEDAAVVVLNPPTTIESFSQTPQPNEEPSKPQLDADDLSSNSPALQRALEQILRLDKATRWDIANKILLSLQKE